MFRKKAIATFVALAFAGIPLITTASCDPYTRTFDFFRDDDNYDYYHDDYIYYDDYYYDDYYYDPYYDDDCCWFDWW